MWQKQKSCIFSPELRWTGIQLKNTLELGVTPRISQATFSRNLTWAIRMNKRVLFGTTQSSWPYARVVTQMDRCNEKLCCVPRPPLHQNSLQLPYSRQITLLLLRFRFKTLHQQKQTWHFFKCSFTTPPSATPPQLPRTCSRIHQCSSQVVTIVLLWALCFQTRQPSYNSVTNPASLATAQGLYYLTWLKVQTTNDIWLNPGRKTTLWGLRGKLYFFFGGMRNVDWILTSTSPGTICLWTQYRHSDRC